MPYRYLRFIERKINKGVDVPFFHRYLKAEAGRVDEIVVTCNGHCLRLKEKKVTSPSFLVCSSYRKLANLRSYKVSIPKNRNTSDRIVRALNNP